MDGKLRFFSILIKIWTLGKIQKIKVYKNLNLFNPNFLGFKFTLNSCPQLDGRKIHVFSILIQILLKSIISYCLSRLVLLLFRTGFTLGRVLVSFGANKGHCFLGFLESYLYSNKTCCKQQQTKSECCKSGGVFSKHFYCD